MKGSDHGVLFQNSDGTINMGIWFNDPDIEMYDICWLNVIAREIDRYLYSNEGLITIDDELDIRSCYAELHRIWIKKLFNEKIVLYCIAYTKSLL